MSPHSLEGGGPILHVYTTRDPVRIQFLWRSSDVFELESADRELLSLCAEAQKHTLTSEPTVTEGSGVLDPT